MKIVQLNLNHARNAQDLLMQMTKEKCIDVALLSEPYRAIASSGYLMDKSDTAAIWTCGKHAMLEIKGQTAGFVRAKVKGIYFYSCYARPSWTIQEFQNMLDQIVTDAQGKAPLVIAGDFNAWATEWGSRWTNQRGARLLESFASLGISLVTNEQRETYNRAGRSSIIDIAFVSDSLLSRTKTWVCGDYTHSDHQAVMMEITDGKPSIPPKLTGPKWNANSFDQDVFEGMLDSSELVAGSANTMARELVNHVVVACDAAMPRRRQSRRGAPCYWWNDEIKENRARCLRARRKAQRGRHAEDSERRLLEFRQARRELEKSIKESKRRCFKALIDESDVNPWGTAYRMVMSRIKGPKGPTLMCYRKLKEVVEHLFPARPARLTIIQRNIDVATIPPVSTEEILEASSHIKDKKAPGPDGIPNKAIKVAMRRRPDLFREVFQGCLGEGVFPDQWKLQQLVLLPKGNKSPDDPSAYRPICLLDTIGKVLERIISKRLLKVAEDNGALSERQFGFRKARSTVDAIQAVVEIATAAIEGGRWRYGTMEYCAVVTLDIRNAFNSAEWCQIRRALVKMKTPQYLVKMIESYFSRRRLRYFTDEGTKYHEVTAGVPQGSVLGPLLWNLMYDGIFRLEMPQGVKLVGFADDVALVAVKKHVHQMEESVSEAITRIKRWLSEMGLELADHKTEALLVTGRKRIEAMTIRVGREQIVSSPKLKYLGVILDNRLNFRSHVEYCSEKASRVQAALARIMPNVGGAKQARRTLLSRVVASVLLYAAPVWTRATGTLGNRRKLASVHRLSALRVISGYRTVSEEAALVIAGMMPIDIIADEMARIYARKTRDQRMMKIIKDEERTTSMAKWQDRWTSSPKGRWTHALIPSIETWVNRDHGECGYHLTQFLSGHGGYRKYLHRFGHDESPMCPSCEVEEDTEHAVFYCDRFAELRTGLPAMSDILGYMLTSEEEWRTVLVVVTNIQKELRRIEAERRSSTMMEV